MIRVKRINHDATYAKRSGELLHEAHYECKYYSENDDREIAWYSSRRDVLSLRTDYIGHDFKKSIYERATTCDRADEYKYLFGMLGVDETSHLSEYTYM